VIDLSISDKNTRTILTLPKELKARLEEEAKEENRSFNNYVLTILENRNKK
jgi:predicted HicB family RNase H-like nuclease